MSTLHIRNLVFNTVSRYLREEMANIFNLFKMIKVMQAPGKKKQI